MNCVAYGRQRDDKIVSLIGNGHAFTRVQLERIIVPDRKSRTRIMQHRLSRLVKTQRIKKMQRVPYEPCIYYLKKPKNIDHYLAINNVYCALLEQKPAWITLEFSWSYSILGGKVWADGMIVTTDAAKRRKQVIWLEVERHPSKKFNKVEQYEKIFKSVWYNEEWAVLKDGVAYFPTILIVTDEKVKINLKEPRFVVATTEQVQKDVYSALRRD